MPGRNGVKTSRPSIEAILAKDTIVEVVGESLTLRRPTRAQAVALQEGLIAFKDDKGEIGQEQQTEIFDFIEKMVMCCLPDIKNQDEAFAIISAAGGYESDLVRKCYGLCGFNLPGDEDSPAPDPSRSSSSRRSGSRVSKK